MKKIYEKLIKKWLPFSFSESEKIRSEQTSITPVIRRIYPNTIPSELVTEEPIQQYTNYYNVLGDYDSLDEKTLIRLYQEALQRALGFGVPKTKVIQEEMDV